MSMFAEPQTPESAVSRPPANRALIALATITIVGLVGGGVLMISGAAMNASANPYLSLVTGANPLPGLGAIIWGGGFISTGVLGLIGWLTAKAVRWIPPQS